MKKEKKDYEKKRKKVLVISEFFWPDQASTGKLLGDLFFKIQQNCNYEIFVLTSNQLYRNNSREIPPKEKVGNVNIKRVKTLKITNKGNFLIRLLSDFYFSLVAFFLVLFKSFDTVFVVTNPPIMPLVVNFIVKFRRRKLVYLIHDLYPDVPVALKLWEENTKFVKAVRFFQKKALSNSTQVVVLGRCMKEYLIECYSFPSKKIKVITNWFTVEKTNEEKIRNKAKQKKEFNVLYTGNIGQFHDFETVLRGAGILSENPKIKIIIVGEGFKRDYIEEEISKRKLKNIELKTFLAKREFEQVLENAHVGFLSLEPKMEGLGVPSKIYNYFAKGLPVIAIVSDFSEVARIIEEKKVGLRVNYGDFEAFAKKILYLFNNKNELYDMSLNSLKYAENFTTLENTALKFEKLL